MGIVKGLLDPKEVESLTPMPAAVARLASVMCDPKAGVPDFVEIIQYDETLTARALRLANSAWGSRGKPVDNVKDAILRVGIGRILEMAVAQSLVGPMTGSCDTYELRENELWRHSLAAALATERMGKVAGRNIPGAAFTAALVHDIGKLLLARHVGVATLESIIREAEVSARPFVVVEREILGVDHAQVGAEIARVWGFPDMLVKAIRGHHGDVDEPNALTDAVEIANVVAKLIGIGLGSEQMNLKANPEVATRLGLSSAKLEMLCAIVADELAAKEELWRK